MVVQNDADTGVVEPLKALYEIRKTAAREMLALAVNKVFDYPVAELKVEMVKLGIEHT